MSIKKLLQDIKNVFDRPSLEEIAAYQHKIPTSIVVTHTKDKTTGYYVARVVEFDGKPVNKGLIITESKTVEGLVAMVNDAVFAYLDIPERMRSNLPKMLPEDINFADKIAKEGRLVFAK